jgi:hypothetical protein
MKAEDMASPQAGCWRNIAIAQVIGDRRSGFGIVSAMACYQQLSQVNTTLHWKDMHIWTGIACLAADPNCKEFRRFGDDGKGAYVNIVAWATSEQEFAERVKQTATELDCLLLELGGIKLLEQRMEEPEYPEELINMRTTAWRQPKDVVFGAFHIWTQSDAN